jgi:HEAT repeat protein
MKPSKGAAIFFTLFGLVFLLPGLLLLFNILTRNPNFSANTLTGLIIALLISAIGAGLIFAAFSGYRRMQQLAAMEEANPASPWLWKPDWAANRANSQNKGKEIVLWALCVFVNAILLPATLNLLPEMLNRLDPRAFMFIALDAAGALLFAYAVRASLRRQRFGKTYFEFYSLPFSPGGRLTGRIHLQFNTTAEHGIDLTLSCVRKTATDSGNNRTIVKTVLWQADQNVPSGAITVDPFGRAIPVDFAIPADAYSTDQNNLSDQVLWILHAQADVPGVNYSDDFEVPVFRAAGSFPTAQEASPESAFGAPPRADSEMPIAAPAHPGVRISSIAGGTEFYFPPFRNPGRALLLFAVLLAWTGLCYFLWQSNTPKIFAVFFSIADLLVIYGCFHVAFSSARIRVGNGEVVSIRRTLGLGSAKRFAIAEIEAIVPVTGGQQTNTKGDPIYCIRLRTKNGQRVTLADEIASRQEARWVVSQIESLAGLQLNTQVEVDMPLGASPLPPQRTLPGQPVFSPGRGASQRAGQSRASSIIAFAVFIGIAGSMFALQAWRFSNAKQTAAANSRARRARQTQNATGNLRKPGALPANAFIPAKAMSEEDAERILTLPPQDQAEELLERAIQHDPKALDLFEQNVDSWVGHIRLTDHMRDLENRSQFSKDLRVRYANADIFLTVDGWHKNEAAVDMLIERAKNDAQYRAAAVFFLGMMAGRGVAYDKIHPVLLDYARNNPDATVRQWAVEGLRYLGTDQALDELWESFTQDPAMQVRERAGCNISDCGNFTRRQRMRMVPKFLELLNESKLDPQVRNWCFMALREITDENLPANAQAWQTWYGQHGAAKLAEFERLNWWQVRGDE